MKKAIYALLLAFLPSLAWGQESKGWSFFFKAGPQIGLYLSESTQRNYTAPNLATDGTGRANTIVKQEDAWKTKVARTERLTFLL